MAGVWVSAAGSALGREVTARQRQRTGVAELTAARRSRSQKRPARRLRARTERRRRQQAPSQVPPLLPRRPLVPGTGHYNSSGNVQGSPVSSSRGTKHRLYPGGYPMKITGLNPSLDKRAAPVFSMKLKTDRSGKNTKVPHGRMLGTLLSADNRRNLPLSFHGL